MKNSKTLFLIKYGEIALKGRNRRYFTRLLRENILKQLGSNSAEIEEKEGRLYLSVDAGEADTAEPVLSRVFGIHGFSASLRTDKNMESVTRHALALGRTLLSKGHRFKIEARRADKSFLLNSYEIACELGDRMREAMPSLKVDLDHPDWLIHVEIREAAYLYPSTWKGPGGLPVGCSGRGLLLLSGGIDSPAAGYLMARRGVRIDSVYYHTPPFVSEKAREKVEDLTGILSRYTPRTSLYIVPYTEIQVKIKEEGDAEAVTLYSRAAMMEIATGLARRNRIHCLITGESLGQVASQTVESLAFTGSRTVLPLFRPLIGMDKEDIIHLARKIGTYETSILPYPDCCTLFSPEHPLIHPDLRSITTGYDALNLGSYIHDAVRNAEKMQFKRGEKISAKN